MKIEGPGRSQETSKTSKKGKSAPGSAASFAGMMSSEPAAAGVSGGQPSQSIAQLDALLALQGAEDPALGASKKRMRARAGVILDEMEKLRMAMLTGTLTVGHMIDIADVVASHREKIADPALSGIMDEIDLRAQVELAKMRRALDQKS